LEFGRRQEASAQSISVEVVFPNEAVFVLGLVFKTVSF